MACLRKPRVRAESTHFDQQKLLANGDTLDKSLPGFLLKAAAEHVSSDKTNWMINAMTDEHVQFADFDPMSRRVASWLYKKGIRKGDVLWVSLYATERLHCILNGIWMANGIVRSAFLDEAAGFKEDAVVEKLKELQIKMIFCNITNAAFYLSVALKIDWPIYILTNGDQQGCVSLREIFDDDALDVPALEIVGKDPALIFSPNAASSVDIVHSQESTISMIRNFAKFLPYDEQPLLISANPSHVIAILCPLTLLFCGRTGLMIPRPERRDLNSVSRLTQKYLQKTFDKHQPNSIIGIPYSLEWISKADIMDFSTIKYIYTGGGPKSSNFSEIVKHLPNFISNISGYWLREIGVIAYTEVLSFSPSNSLTTSGKPIDGVAIRILDVITGEPIDQCCKGEIVFKSEDSGNNEWQTTGDIGYFDSDGILHITDFVGDIITTSNGLLIFPSDVQDALNRHPLVVEACVFGQNKDNCSIEKGFEYFMKAAVKILPGSNVTTKDLVEFTNNQLEYLDDLKLGNYVFFVGELPKDKPGKFCRELIAQMLIEQ